jgi:serine protease Do
MCSRNDFSSWPFKDNIMNLKPIVGAFLAVGLSIGLAAGCTRAIDQSIAQTVQASSANSNPSVPLAPVSSTALPNFTFLVAKYGAAVVNISVTGNVKVNDDRFQFPSAKPDDPFWQFFRNFQLPQMPSNVPTHSLGSGFIVSPDGIILTNAHVVDDAKQVTVKLVDKREFKAKVLGKDDVSDVAVLKINARDLPAVKLGNSAHVQVGEWVVAIGSPFGFDNSVTAGIVSAKARSLPNGGFVPFLQTDVPVNPGNSGGPLFNLNGEVVGINSQIYSGTGGFEGLSFAIPINVAQTVRSQLELYGHVTRGKLGVTIQDVNQGLADSFGLPKPSGALISSVDPDGAAAKAGIRAGDVILRMDGKDVVQPTDLAVMVAELKPAAKATLQIWRDGAARDISVTMGEFKDNAVASSGASGEAHGKLGLVVRPATAEERMQGNFKGGVIVSEATGPTAQAGIEPGDVVLSLNGKPVENLAQMRELVEKSGKHVALLVLRGGARLFVPIDLG